MLEGCRSLGPFVAAVLSFVRSLGGSWSSRVNVLAALPVVESTWFFGRLINDPSVVFFAHCVSR